MGLRYVFYVVITLKNKDDFEVLCEPTLNLYNLLDIEGESENDLIIELDGDYFGSVSLAYRWDTKNNRWQMFN